MLNTPLFILLSLVYPEKHGISVILSRSADFPLFAPPQAKKRIRPSC